MTLPSTYVCWSLSPVIDQGNTDLEVSFRKLGRRRWTNLGKDKSERASPHFKLFADFGEVLFENDQLSLLHCTVISMMLVSGIPIELPVSASYSTKSNIAVQYADRWTDAPREHPLMVSSHTNSLTLLDRRRMLFLEPGGIVRRTSTYSPDLVSLRVIHRGFMHPLR